MNLKEETRSGYRVSAEMKKVWETQLKLLSSLLQVCNSYGLRIWADGGTLLGAIRHKGYIPWDDDIDMVMLREDYDKLVEVSSTAFKPPFFFQSAYSEDVPYPRGHSQLRMDNTTAILPTDINQGFHQGIFIDIFPYDAVPEDPISRARLIQERNRMINAMAEYTYGSLSLFNRSHNRILRGIRREIDEVGFKAYYTRFENLFRAYPVSDNGTVACLTFNPDLKKFQRETAWYEETLMVPFEDTMIPVPVGYDQILTKQYGDYMTPVQAPSYHGGFAVLDTGKPYSDYIPALRRKRTKEIWKESLHKYFGFPAR